MKGVVVDKFNTNPDYGVDMKKNKVKERGHIV